MRLLLLSLALSLPLPVSAATIDVLASHPDATLVSLSDAPDLTPSLIFNDDPWLVLWLATTGIDDDGTWTGEVWLNDTLVASHTDALIPSAGSLLYGGLSFALGECCYLPQDGHVEITVTGFAPLSVPFTLTQPIPEPSTLLLVGPALMALRRRGRSRTRRSPGTAVG